MRVLRLGVIGLGGAARQMLPSFAAHPAVRIVAAADPREEARARYLQHYGGAVFADAAALCGSDLVDAVYIATPHHLHAEQCISAARHGKHVLVEKPMALTLPECDAMIQAAESAGVKIVVGHTHGFDAPVREMGRMIHSGDYGRLAMINTCNYNDYLYRPRWPAELRTELGGGVIFNQVPHQVDIVRLLGGGMVRSVRSRAWMLDRARPTEGSHMTFIEFVDGAVCSMTFSGYDRFDSDEWHAWVGELGEDKAQGAYSATRARFAHLHGTPEEEAFKRSLAYGGSRDGTNLPPFERADWHQPHFGVTVATCERADLRLSADGVLVYDASGRSEVRVPRGRVFPNKDDVVDELYAAFAEGSSPLFDGRWGKATLEVCLAILTSSNERREVSLSCQVPVRVPRA